jgi:protein-S-isoprenylcysteine O-methyltransferase Ste14
MFSIYVVVKNLINSFGNPAKSNNLFDFNIYKLIGIFFLLISVFLFTYLNFFEKSFPSCRTIKEKKLLSGIYNYIRHPSHYVIFFITFGTALTIESPTFLFFAIVNHCFIYYYYIIEENQIKKTHPDYQKFLDKTNRFLPYFNINK